MMKLLTALGAWLLLGLCSFRDARAASRDLEFRLVYRVPPGCPEADTFLARLNEHVAHGGNNYLEGAIVVTPVVEGGFRLQMQFNGSRLDELRGEDCDELVAAAVRTGGMARTDSPGEKAGEQMRSAIEGAPDPQTWTAKQPRPVLPVRADAPPLKPAARVAREKVWRASILAHGQWVSGALPEPRIGWGVTGAASYGRLQARLEATIWPEQRWELVSGGRLDEVSLEQQALALALCYDLNAGLEPFTITACARGGVVRLQSTASRDYSAGALPYSSFGARLGMAWQYSGFQVELLGGVDVIPGNPTLSFSGLDVEFAPRNGQQTLALSIGGQFGASASDLRVASPGKDTARAD
jgi:hypothetical protein